MTTKLKSLNLTEGYIGIQMSMTWTQKTKTIYGASIYKIYGSSKSYEKHGYIGKKNKVCSGRGKSCYALSGSNYAGLSVDGYSGDDFNVLGGSYQNAVYHITLVKPK